MTEVQFAAMVSAYAIYFGPMMDTWRVVMLTLCVVGGFVIGVALMLHRSISSYL